MWEEKLAKVAALIRGPAGAPWRLRLSADTLCWSLCISVSTGRGNQNKKEADGGDPFALVFTK